MGVKKLFLGRDLRLGDTAHQAGADVVRLGGRAVVGVSAYVEVEAVGSECGVVHHGRESIDRKVLVVDGDNFFRHAPAAESSGRGLQKTRGLR